MSEILTWLVKDQSKVYISQLKTCHNPNSSQLVIRFLDLVKEMENVSASWAVAEAHLMEYSHEQEKMEEDDAGGLIAMLSILLIKEHQS